MSTNRSSLLVTGLLAVLPVAGCAAPAPAPATGEPVLIYLKHIDATEAARTLREFDTDGALAVAPHAESNSVLLSGDEIRLRHAFAILDKLDVERKR